MPTLHTLGCRAAFALSMAVLPAVPSAQDAPATAHPAKPTPSEPRSRLLDPFFDASSLLERPFSGEARHGLAIWHLSGGRLATGIAELETLVATTGEVERPLLERNRARALELIDLRNELFTSCRDGARKLKLELGGRTRVVTVQSVDAEGLTLALAKGETTRKPLDEIDFATFVRLLEETKLEPGSPAGRAFAVYLAGKSYWKRGAAGGTPTETALLEDEADLNRLLALGATVGKLHALSRTPLAADDDTSQRALTTLQELWKTEAGAEFVAERAGELRQLAIEVLARSVTARELFEASWEEGIHGKVEHLENGRVRITWTFDDPVEASDWSVLPLDEQFDVELKTPDGEGRMAVEDGALSALGKHYWRSALQFEAPMSVTWRVVFGSPDTPAEPVRLSVIRVSMCDEGYWKRIVAANGDGMFSIDEDQSSHSGYPQGYRFGTPYTIAMHHVGETAELDSPSFPSVSVPTFGRKSGYVCLYLVTDLVLRIEELTIEGAIALASFLEWRDYWILKELERLGAP